MISSISLASQDSTIYNSYSLYKSKAEEIGILDTKIKLFFDAKLDLNKLESYNNLGLNLIESSKFVNGFPFDLSLLISSHAINGEVIDIEYNSDTNAMYHTTIRVKVKEMLRGVTLNDTICILQISGMRGNKYLKYDFDSDYVIGLNYIFFLANTLKSLESSSSTANLIILNNYSDYSEYNKTFTIKNSKLINENNKIQIAKGTFISIQDIKSLIIKLDNLKFN